MIAARIGVDARALTPPITGTGVYLRELLAELGRQAPELEVLCYTTRPKGVQLPSPSCRLRAATGLRATWGNVWLQSGLPAQSRRDRIELFWGPLQVLPLPLIGETPTLVTVHDLVFRRYPRTMSWRNRLLLDRLATPSLQRADRVIAVSETTARDVVRELALDPSRVGVVGNAVGGSFRPRPREETEPALARHGLRPDHFLLFVGTLEPRKNLRTLLQALRHLVETDAFDGQVALVGVEGWTGELEREFRDHPLGERLVRTGYVPEAELPALYSAARLFVMPSLYEGFGLPVLEAMACGTPVVCSDVEPFPETTGGAAVLVSPRAPEAWAETIARLWKDDGTRDELRTRGLERAATFSWRRSASELLQVLGELIDA